jgi:glucan phosphoethanolaminetransferase (alkaline phosphatase superfamily)
MVSDYKKKTDEELIAIVNQYMEDHPNANRNHIILHAHGSHQKNKRTR